MSSSGEGMNDTEREHRAKVIAAMGLVGRDGDGFSVTQPGFAKETLRVWKDESGKVHCSCAEYQEGVQAEPRFRCVHILAVKEHLLTKQKEQPPWEETTEPRRPLQGFPRDPVAKTMAELVTPRQLVAIRVIANSQGINAEGECRRLLGCVPEELSRKAASAFIDHLKGIHEQEQRDRKLAG